MFTAMVVPKNRFGASEITVLHSYYRPDTDGFSAPRRHGKNAREADNRSTTFGRKIVQRISTKAKSAFDLGARTPAGAKPHR